MASRRAPRASAWWGQPMGRCLREDGTIEMLLDFKMEKEATNWSKYNFRVKYLVMCAHPPTHTHSRAVILNPADGTCVDGLGEIGL